MNFFKPKKEVALTIDVSEHAIASIISQESHSVIFLSIKLTALETNSTNIKKEALEIV